MIDRDKLPDNLKEHLYGDGYEEEFLRKELSFVPSWVPEDFWDFWRSFSAFTVYSIMFLPPAGYGVYENALKGFYQDFCSLDYVDSKRFFPVAFDDMYRWGVIEISDSSSFKYGMYDFEFEEYYMGPFGSLEQWVSEFSNIISES